MAPIGSDRKTWGTEKYCPKPYWAAARASQSRRRSRIQDSRSPWYQNRQAPTMQVTLLCQVARLRRYWWRNFLAPCRRNETCRGPHERIPPTIPWQAGPHLAPFFLLSPLFYFSFFFHFSRIAQVNSFLLVVRAIALHGRYEFFLFLISRLDPEQQPGRINYLKNQLKFI